ncbi:hypothetical protein HANVADRAFT_51297 [Hanseniaspora valbyensis NRRL Y-1626]|uniref:Endoplasmic reticulum transmembrane protein n=1 Tax=Hanseniaspora valbyensis NRRL Y-1626 TaxID=766949 RepID=A0A1B7TJN7_9ASCO|nr:hypothetical protein HANVADRAFT_51297 [Hanseniaspora valbyensis NRRL Y-1626]
MTLFLVLIFPLPNKLHQLKKHFIKLLNFVAYKNDTTKIVSRSVFIFILLMFIDSIKKLQNISYSSVSARMDDTYGQQNFGGEYSGNQMDPVRANINKSEYYREKFFAQRNMYLTGFTLFLCFMILRTIQITNELLEGLSKENKPSKNSNFETEEVLKKKINEYEEKIDNLSKKILLEDESI